MSFVHLSIVFYFFGNRAGEVGGGIIQGSIWSSEYMKLVIQGWDEMTK